MIASAGDLRQGTHEFFDTTFARVVTVLVDALASAWVWLGVIIPSLGFGHSEVRPLTWIIAQCASAGWTVPHWLDRVSASTGPEWLFYMLVAAVLVLVSRSATSRAPGYRLTAMLLMATAMQWYGADRAIEHYAVVTLAGILLASVGVVWTRKRTAGTVFDLDSIVVGVVHGPMEFFFMPVIFPLIVIGSVVNSFGYGQKAGDETDVVFKAIANLPTANPFSPRDAAMAAAAIELVASAGPEQRSNIVNGLRRRLEHASPTGAVPVPPRQVAHVLQPRRESADQRPDLLA